MLLQRRLLDPALQKCQGELDNLLRRVNAALATRRATALAEVSQWDNQRVQIQQYADEIEATLKREFETWQERFINILGAHLSLPQEDQPRTQTYNPSAPLETRARVSEEVKRVILKVLDGIEREYANAFTRLRAIDYSGDLDALPPAERDVAVGRANGCQDLLAEIYQIAEGLVDQAESNAGAIFTDPSLSFEEFCQSLGQLQVKAGRMAGLLRQVEDALSEARLSEREQALLDAVTSLAGETGPRVDIGMLLQQSGQPITTVMALFSALIMKRRLYVTVERAISSRSLPTERGDAQVP